eukprot:symbB.v1.2.016386.t1/scaffold1246.1/size129174/3
MADDQVADQAYDEAIPVETDDEVSTPGTSEAGTPGAQPPAAGTTKRGEESSGESSSEGSTSESSDGEEGGKKSSGLPAGAYNPDDFKNMKVSNEIEELFNCITRYKPHSIELDTVLKPFIPELIPSIGEVDAFLKMPRPDDEASGLGTTRLDEPTLNPSDPSILDLQLRSLSKNQDLQPMEVRSIENAEKNPKEIDNWVKRIDNLNRTKPAPTVQYQRRMPDIEQLMQVWPGEFEEFLQNNPLPDLADLELDLPSYIKVFASILDVPVYNQITETLHVIFTLYSEFKSNQHFSKTDTTGNFGDQYNFGSVPASFGQPSASAAPAAFGSAESMAPSRAPSPVHLLQPAVTVVVVEDKLCL